MPAISFIVRRGLLGQILFPAVIGVVLCIGAVQTWTLRVERLTAEHQIWLSVNASHALLRAYLSPLGTEWSRTGDDLKLGLHSVVAHGDIVDLVSKATDGVATIFSGDTRALTSVRLPDGGRAVGTRLADPEVRTAVLEQGLTYRGLTTILGHRYFAIYEPIRDAAGQIVGILFTGISTAGLDAAEADTLKQALIVCGVVIPIFVLALTWLLNNRLRPLGQLADATKQIAGGQFMIDILHTDRHDEVGAMATAVQILKDSAIEKLRLEGMALETQKRSEGDRSRIEAEKTLLASEQSHVVSSLAQGLDSLANGALRFRIVKPFTADYDKLRLDFNGAMEKLQDTIQVVAANSTAIRSGTTEISSATDDLSRRTEQQAASLGETAAALDEITATVRKTAEGSKHARDVVGQAKKDAEHSGQVVRQAVDAMNGIEKSANQISQIISVIDEIAFQTNLLALNAGVEAARAGEAGRGFAVVASEVRALAQRSAEAAKEIKVLISASNSQVEMGVDLVGHTGKALEQIVLQIIEINEIVAEIAASAQEQARGLDQVNIAVNQMDQVTQQNAAMVEETTAASHALVRDTDELSRVVGSFDIGSGAAGLTARPMSAGRLEPTRPPGPTLRRVVSLKTSGQGSAARKVMSAADIDSWQEF